MTLPSSLSTATFLSILGYVLAIICWTHIRCDAGEAMQRLRNVAAFCAVWLAIGASFVLARYASASVFLIQFVLFVGLIVVTVSVALSRYGRRIAFGVPLILLVGFHAFRLPLELVLDNWWQAGFFPIQMTYYGDNYDIATGVLAIAATAAIWKYGDLRWLAWVLNLVGFALLIRIFIIVNLSNPTPLKAIFGGYPAGQEVLVALFFPYVWLATVIVPAALFFHLVLFRRLLDR